MYDHGHLDIRTVEKKFRMASVIDMQSAPAKSLDQDINWDRVQLFTPVSLNPLLKSWDVVGQRIEDEQVGDGSVGFTARGKLAQFAAYGSARATFITGPPCSEIKVMLDYVACPSRPGFHFLGCAIKFKSDKPLTIGDAIDRALETKRIWTLETKHQRESIDVTEDITATEKIAQLEKQHACKVVLEAFYITPALNNTLVRPLPLTDAEHLRYKPTENEPKEDGTSEGDSSGSGSPESDSSGSDSLESDSLGVDSSEDDSAEDEPTESVPTEGTPQ
jgi:hypothetical protein